MLDVITLTEDNIDEVAKLSGRKPADLRMELLDFDGKPVTKPVKIWIDKPDIPEGFGRS